MGLNLAPPEGADTNLLGLGINCFTGRPVTSPSAISGAKPGELIDKSYAQSHKLVVQDASTYSNMLSTAASMSASGLSWSASASVSYLRDRAGSETSISLIALCDKQSSMRAVDISGATVSQDALDYLKQHGPAAFADRYGTHYIAGLLYGGSFAGRLKITTETSEARDSVAAAVHGDLNGFGVSGSVSASFTQTVTSTSSSATMDVSNTATGGAYFVQPSDLPSLISACDNFTLADNPGAGCKGDVIALVCSGWDDFPAIQDALNHLNPPQTNAFEYAAVQSKLTTLSSEFANLSYIANSCQDLKNQGRLGIPVYQTLLDQIAGVCDAHRTTIQNLSMSAVGSIDLDNYVISGRLDPLLGNVATGQVLIEVGWSLDGAFQGETNGKAQHLLTFDGQMRNQLTLDHGGDPGNGPQTMNINYLVGLDADGNGTVKAFMHWHDPYGPPNQLDIPGPVITPSGPTFASQTSVASWPSFPWNQTYVRLVGLDPGL